VRVPPLAIGRGGEGGEDHLPHSHPLRDLRNSPLPPILLPLEHPRREAALDLSQLHGRLVAVLQLRRERQQIFHVGDAQVRADAEAQLAARRRRAAAGF
jgi:hypothetical protein